MTGSGFSFVSLTHSLSKPTMIRGCGGAEEDPWGGVASVEMLAPMLGLSALVLRTSGAPDPGLMRVRAIRERCVRARNSIGTRARLRFLRWRRLGLAENARHLWNRQIIRYLVGDSNSDRLAF